MVCDTMLATNVTGLDQDNPSWWTVDSFCYLCFVMVLSPQSSVLGPGSLVDLLIHHCAGSERRRETREREGLAIVTHI